ncbi:probable potassium transporter 13 isoform X1 [Chenopodium quinoa]|uniref:probable potassium transporter 13 isoform X1 n=2 Tax=Chenopodium quinoa TaxID=63459 RepID=UPI000B785F9F|nr:probable potassium transporter 13 isoform X1 [Chenopodium quinoa]XP_021774494.1 probable potassium transporter 13 isoform X1 [Chenopodium quinoa]XP_021774495.1 probable potassium transporter 13 isoform X1 [Chenopodium quinoa]
MELSTHQSRLEMYQKTFCLAYQSLGIVYGDLSTSPIYVYKSTFSGKLRLYEEDLEIFGILSMVFWTLTLVPLCKYIVFVLSADDNGEGGTFALYSLLCRSSKMGFFCPSQMKYAHPSYEAATSGKESRSSLALKEFFEKHYYSRLILFLVVLLGTSMVIGDGIFTPTMSVLSAVSGLKVKIPHLNEYLTLGVTCIILMGIFSLQHCGTSKVGFLFAPILVAWLLCVGGVGLYNIIHWNPGVIRAVSPYYVYKFFKVTGKVGWSSLGGVVLCITGAEAMFADLGHFSQLSLRIAFSGFVYPCLVLAYMGEAAYLSKHREDLQSSFYKAIPESIFWPFFVIATLATVVASQAIISATFSIISQCRALKCFPRVRMVHTSDDIYGRIYIPEANWILMVLCLAVVLGFRDTDKIGNAYGLAVITVMFVTTCLMFLIIVTVWKKHVLVALFFVLFFGSIELSYMSACLIKIHQGGWVPLVSSLVILCLMSLWKYGTMKKQAFEHQNKVGLDRFLTLGPSLGVLRVPGIGLIYSNVTSGVPPMFSHFVANFPAFHQVLIFVTIEILLIPRVPVNERLVIGRVGPPELHIFRCTVRYGYKDTRDSYDFESKLIDEVAEFLQHGPHDRETLTSPNNVADTDAAPEGGAVTVGRRRVRFREVEPSGPNVNVKKLMEARQSGVAYMIGNTCVVAREESSFFKKIAINIVYRFLRQNCRRPAVALGIPHTSLIEVGMVYHV